jgi:hypothetical protein
MGIKSEESNKYHASFTWYRTPELKKWHWELPGNTSFNPWIYKFETPASELRTAISQKETSDMEKAEMGEKLRYALNVN